MNRSKCPHCIELEKQVKTSVYVLEEILEYVPGGEFGGRGRRWGAARAVLHLPTLR